MNIATVYNVGSGWKSIVAAGLIVRRLLFTDRPSGATRSERNRLFKGLMYAFVASVQVSRERSRGAIHIQLVSDSNNIRKLNSC